MWERPTSANVGAGNSRPSSVHIVPFAQRAATSDRSSNELFSRPSGSRIASRTCSANGRRNAKLLEASPDAWVMHCMPAHRGEEITDEILDGERSLVYEQAENRLHSQKAIMERLMARSLA